MAHLKDSDFCLSSAVVVKIILQIHCFLIPTAFKITSHPSDKEKTTSRLETLIFRSAL